MTDFRRGRPSDPAARLFEDERGSPPGSWQGPGQRRGSTMPATRRPPRSAWSTPPPLNAFHSASYGRLASRGDHGRELENRNTVDLKGGANGRATRRVAPTSHPSARPAS